MSKGDYTIMVQIKVPNALYYMFVGLFTYFLSERFLVKKEEPKSTLDLRGGEEVPIEKGLLRLLRKDQSLKLALLSVFFTVIKTELNDETVSALSKLLAKAKVAIPRIIREGSPAILAYTPAASSSTAIDETKNVMNVVRLNLKIAQLKKILKAEEIESIRELLLNETLSPIDKLTFLMIKVKILLKNLKGRKRYIFIMALLSLLYFIFANETLAFTGFLASVRELFKLTNLDDELSKNYIIEWHQEFNTTLPEELINKVME